MCFIIYSFIDSSHLNTPDSFSSKSIIPCGINENIEKHPDLTMLRKSEKKNQNNPGFIQKLNSGLRLIHHPSFVETRSAVCLVRKQTNEQTET